MGKFDSGVKEYVMGVATVYNSFPVNWKGESDISCKQCRFFRTTSRTCALNDEVCEYPDKFVGSKCPLERYVESEEIFETADETPADGEDAPDV